MWAIGETLPIGTTLSLPFSISVIAPPPPGGQVLVSIDYVDGLKGLGVPVNNAVSFDGSLVTMIPNNDGLHLMTNSCELRFGIPIFLRADYDGSGLTDLTDAINMLGFLFLGTHPPICLDAADVDNSAILDLTDPITLLQCLFIVSCPEITSSVCKRDPAETFAPGDGRPIQPGVSLGCDQYPNPAFLPGAVCE